MKLFFKMKALGKKCTIFGCVLMSYSCISWPASSTAVAVMNCSIKNESSCKLESFAVAGPVSSPAFGKYRDSSALHILMLECSSLAGGHRTMPSMLSG